MEHVFAIEVVRIHGLMPPEQARVKAVELFRALSLPNPDSIGDRYPHQVSGGQLQRLAAAMALIANPKLLIFDEPTTALDVTTQVEVLRAFKSVISAQRLAGIYVSHDLAVVAQIADRIVVLRNGEVQEIGTTADILDRPQHPYTQHLLSAVPHFESGRAARTDAVRLAPIWGFQVSSSCTRSPSPAAASPKRSQNDGYSPVTITSGCQHCVTGSPASNTSARVACNRRAVLSARST
jgi:peptide/nickel transport system ATP-binding protein